MRIELCRHAREGVGEKTKTRRASGSSDQPKQDHTEDARLSSALSDSQKHGRTLKETMTMVANEDRE